MSETAQERTQRLFGQVEWLPTRLHSPEVGSGQYVPRAPTQAEVQAEIEAAERTARRQALQEACALICRACYAGYPVSWGMHTYENGRKSYCEAISIHVTIEREKMAEAATQERLEEQKGENDGKLCAER